MNNDEIYVVAVKIVEYRKQASDLVDGLSDEDKVRIIDVADALDGSARKRAQQFRRPDGKQGGPGMQPLPQPQPAPAAEPAAPAVLTRPSKTRAVK